MDANIRKANIFNDQHKRKFVEVYPEGLSVVYPDTHDNKKHRFHLSDCFYFPFNMGVHIIFPYYLFMGVHIILGRSFFVLLRYWFDTTTGSGSSIEAHGDDR